MENESSSTTVTINLDEHRPEGATSWELPPWGHPLGLGVYPLLLNLDDLYTPVGTAFCISKLGIVATASHVLAEEALKWHPRGQRMLQEGRFPKDLNLKDVGDPRFSVLHGWQATEETLHVTLWPLESAHGLLAEDDDRQRPIDLSFGSTKFQSSFPFLPLPISFAVPRIGSKVKCIGYSRAEIPGGQFSGEALRSGKIEDWFSTYRHSFRVVEGRVTKIFTQGFGQGYVRGACFAIDAKVEHGQSGGPVFNEQGYVCGVISAGATTYFDGQPSSLISLLYPAFATGIKFGFSMGPVRMDATHPLFAYVDQGSITTDGSEGLVTLIQEGDLWRVGPMIHKDDSMSVFENFSGHQDGRLAEKEHRPVYRLRRRQTEEPD